MSGVYGKANAQSHATAKPKGERSIIARLKNKVLAATIMGALALAPAFAKAETREPQKPAPSEALEQTGGKEKRFEFDLGSVIYFSKGNNEGDKEKFMLSREQLFLNFEYPIYWRFKGFTALGVENTSFSYEGEADEGIVIAAKLNSSAEPSLAQGLKFKFLDAGWGRLDGLLRGELLVGAGRVNVQKLVLSLGELNLDLTKFAKEHAPVKYNLMRFDAALQAVFKVGGFEPYLTAGFIVIDCTLKLKPDEETRKMISSFGEEGENVLKKGLNFSENSPYGLVGVNIHVWKPIFVFAEGAVIPLENAIVYEGMIGVKTRF